nr:proteasome assembly chaperone 2 isoform X3 [Anser cygnoides]
MTGGGRERSRAPGPAPSRPPTVAARGGPLAAVTAPLRRLGAAPSAPGRHVRPVRGRRPRPPGLHAAHVYSLPSKKLVVLQIRSPFIKNKYRPFCQALLSWVESSKCARVILLSSSHAYQRDDEQLLGTPLRYLLTPALEKAVGGHMQELKWKEMEKIAAYPGINDAEKVLHIPGGGITKLLFTESCSKGIQMAVLLKFCSEGDNIPDAFALVNYLNEWLQLIKSKGSHSTDISPEQEIPDTSSQWKIPSSWRLLFGNGLPPALF